MLFVYTTIVQVTQKNSTTDLIFRLDFQLREKSVILNGNENYELNQFYALRANLQFAHQAHQYIGDS